MDTRLGDLVVDAVKGSRRSAAESRRSRVVRFCVTNEEERWLAEAAAAHGVTVSMFLRSVVGAVRRSMS